MTEAQWTAFEAYVADLAQRMGLGHWRIILNREPADDGDFASVRGYKNKAHAELHLSAQWMDLPPEQWRLSLTHELLHLHTAGTHSALELATGVLGEGQLFRIVYNAHLSAEETAVDGISRVLAPFMPLCELEVSPSAENPSPGHPRTSD